MNTVDFEPYPLELQEMKIIWASIQEKYGTVRATPENMKALKEETEDRFAKIGIEVRVDTANIEPVGDGEDFVVSPVIEVVGRLNDKYGFDFERATRETQLGFYDGQPGMVKADGTWTDPSRYL
jgi:hypothetical protein